MVPKSIKLSPGELKQLIQASLVDVVEAPEFLRACLEEHSGSARTLRELREESGLDHTSLARHLCTLASPHSLLELRRVISRRPTDQSWVCLPRTGERGVTVLMEAGNCVSSLLMFQTAGEWLRWLMEDFDGLPLPGIPLLELPPMPAQSWVVFAALCDEFMAHYPVPREDRQPLDPVCFSAGSLAARLKDTDPVADSWVSSFRAVARETNPGPDPDVLESFLWLQSSEGLLDVKEDEQGIARFFLSPRLMRLVRSLASWDRGFWIGAPGNADHSFLVIQGAGLWVIRKGTTPEGTVTHKLDAVSGDELSAALAQWMRSQGSSRLVIASRPEGIAAPDDEPTEEAASPEVPPPLPALPSFSPPPLPSTAEAPVCPPEIPDIALPPFEEPERIPPSEEKCETPTESATAPPSVSPALRLCLGCGYEEGSAEARFCRECGRPLPAIPISGPPALCANCGQPLTGEMRFCPNCGQAVTSAQ